MLDSIGFAATGSARRHASCTGACVPLGSESNVDVDRAQVGGHAGTGSGAARRSRVSTCHAPG